ncbi:MAG: hypothetical protein ABIA04_01355 [Pseudomonadota bacterium]
MKLYRLISIKKNDGIILLFALMVLTIISVMMIGLLITTGGEKEVLSKDKIALDLRNACISTINQGLRDLIDDLGASDYNFNPILNDINILPIPYDNNAESLDVQLIKYIPYNDPAPNLPIMPSDPSIKVKLSIKDNDIFLNDSVNLDENGGGTPAYNLLEDKDNHILLVAEASKGTFSKKMIAKVKLENEANNYAMLAQNDIFTGAAGYLVTSGSYGDIRSNKGNINFSNADAASKIEYDLYAGQTIEMGSIPAGNYGATYPATTQFQMQPASDPFVKVDALQYCQYLQKYAPANTMYYLNNSDFKCYNISGKASCLDTTSQVDCAAVTNWAWSGAMSRWEKNGTVKNAIFFVKGNAALTTAIGTSNNPWEATIISTGKIDVISGDVIVKPHLYGQNFLFITNFDATPNTTDIILNGSNLSPTPQFGRYRPGIILSGEDVIILNYPKVRGTIISMGAINITAGAILNIEYNGRLQPFPQVVLNNLSSGSLMFGSNLYPKVMKMFETWKSPR